jgi:sugar/nucleoside kinase (ribokinase family)
MRSRPDICASAASKLERANLAAKPALVGLDGFVDAIIDVVDKRSSPTEYERIATITQFGGRISAAAGNSANMELVVKQQKLGGNGPIMANALASLGFPTTYIGNLGKPVVHPVFQPFAQRARVISIAEPAFTDALEFKDGKIMLGNMSALSEITWEHLVGAVGRERLMALMEESALLGLVNWTMLPHMTAIWEGLVAEVLPKLSKADRIVFIDLADPEKRLVEDLRGALETLRKINTHLHVVLGLNLSEAQQVSKALGLAPVGNPEAAIEELAVQIREKLELGTVVVHPRKGAAAANEQGSASFAGPFVREPKISTGAGDHFNSGFAAAQLLEMDLEESLAVGVGTSGYYVREAESPTAKQLAGFLRDLPAPQA